MNARIRNLRDLFAGLIFVGFGVLTIWIARGYPVGSITRMGPGYFPIALGILLSLLGIVVAVRSLFLSGEPIESISPRAVVLVLAAIGVFAVTLESLGIIVATILLVGVGATASPESRLREVIALTALLLGLAVAVFTYGLGLPFKLLPI